MGEELIPVYTLEKLHVAKGRLIAFNDAALVQNLLNAGAIELVDPKSVNLVAKAPVPEPKPLRKGGNK